MHLKSKLSHRSAFLTLDPSPELPNSRSHGRSCVPASPGATQPSLEAPTTPTGLIGGLVIYRSERWTLIAVAEVCRLQKGKTTNLQLFSHFRSECHRGID